MNDDDTWWWSLNTKKNPLERIELRVLEIDGCKECPMFHKISVHSEHDRTIRAKPQNLIQSIDDF